MKKVLIAAGILLCAASIGGTVYVFSAADHKPPVITIPEEEVSYVEGEDYAPLLEGVTAMDDKDGDVTSSLIVENIIPSTDGTTAKAVCVALDRSNNVAKEERTIRYYESENADASAGTEETQVTEEPQAAEQPQPTEETQPAENPEPTEKPGTGENKETNTTEEDEKDTETEEEKPAPGSPKITLSMSEDTIKRGDDVQRLAYVKEISDDKDDENSLYSDIQIKGEVDSSKPGTYELIYYVVDDDGNKSNEAKLKITVE